MKLFTRLLAIILLTQTSLLSAHEGHGTGVGHDLHHMMWLFLAISVPIVIGFITFNRKDQD